MLRALISIACFASSAMPVAADTLRFHGVATTTCALVGGIDGVITLQANLMSWATTQAASIQAVNTAPATITVTRPTSWTSSPAGTPSTTFAHTATLTGINVGTLTGTGTALTSALASLGTTTVTVSLTATANAAYPAGSYDAQVTVTCTVP